MSLQSELTAAQKLYKSGDLDSALDCCKRALRTEDGELGDSPPSVSAIGSVSARTLDEAKHAVACLDAFTVNGL